MSENIGKADDGQQDRRVKYGQIDGLTNDKFHMRVFVGAQPDDSAKDCAHIIINQLARPMETMRGYQPKLKEFFSFVKDPEEGNGYFLYTPISESQVPKSVLKFISNEEEKKIKADIEKAKAGINIPIP